MLLKSIFSQHKLDVTSSKPLNMMQAAKAQCHDGWRKD